MATLEEKIKAFNDGYSSVKERETIGDLTFDDNPFNEKNERVLYHWWFKGWDTGGHHKREIEYILQTIRDSD